MANLSEPDRAEAVARDYRHNRHSVWAWCLALSLALHVALLVAWPGSFETRGTFTVRALDVVLMPETLVPAPRRTNDTAEINKPTEPPTFSPTRSRGHHVVSRVNDALPSCAISLAPPRMPGRTHRR